MRGSQELAGEPGAEKKAGDGAAPRKLSVQPPRQGSTINDLSDLEGSESATKIAMLNRLKLSYQEKLSLSREASLMILKENDNLDLEKYEPFMNEFQKYSSNLFDFGDNNIFGVQAKTQEEITKAKLKLSTKQEYEKTEKMLRMKGEAEVSPERVE